MRKIFVQEPDSEIWKKWIRDCKRETIMAIDAVARGEKPIVNEKLYKRESIKKSYFITKDAPFYGRCAYCESPIADTQYIQIEHFRPKAGVKDANGKVINLKDKNGIDTEKPHNGYYWLAYDWRNLLPTCQRCNNAKSTIFPVDGQHAQLPNDEVNEQPLLINPISELENDSPEKHLSVDPYTGIMSPVNESRRGDMCIKIFGLNEREQLLKSRKDQQVLIEYRLVKFGEIFKDLSKPEKEKESCEAIIETCDYFIDIFKGKEAYTLASFSVLNKYSMNWFQKQRQRYQDHLSKLDG